MSRKYFSLREIARQLDLPPSTVVYYKDRFERYIPHVGGNGRRRMYPPEAVGIIREIRAMYEKKFSAEQIEREIAVKFSELIKGAGNDQQLSNNLLSAIGTTDPGYARSIASVLDKMTGLLEDQSLFKAEIQTLKAEISTLKDEARSRQVRYRKTVDALKKEIGRLRGQRDSMEKYILKKIQRDNIFHSKPEDMFLNLPLVIKNQQGEYLGVSGKNAGHFSLKSLITLIQTNTSATKSVDMHWDRDNDLWRLHIEAQDKRTEKEQSLALELAETVTPNRNIVARLTRMVVDGNTVPDPFLLSLFKQFRDGFGQ